MTIRLSNGTVCWYRRVRVRANVALPSEGGQRRTTLGRRPTSPSPETCTNRLAASAIPPGRTKEQEVQLRRGSVLYNPQAFAGRSSALSSLCPRPRYVPDLMFLYIRVDLYCHHTRCTSCDGTIPMGFSIQHSCDTTYNVATMEDQCFCRCLLVSRAAPHNRCSQPTVRPIRVPVRVRLIRSRCPSAQGLQALLMAATQPGSGVTIKPQASTRFTLVLFSIAACPAL
eukprot:COSAG02_NODE_10192_length_1998_cov_1.447604_2_plen_227_part_00